MAFSGGVQVPAGPAIPCAGGGVEALARCGSLSDRPFRGMGGVRKQVISVIGVGWHA